MKFDERTSGKMPDLHSERRFFVHQISPFPLPPSPFPHRMINLKRPAKKGVEDAKEEREDETNNCHTTQPFLLCPGFSGFRLKCLTPLGAMARRLSRLT
jgi:hypothetical protein